MTTNDSAAGGVAKLRKPVGKFQELVRRLAVRGQETLYHDIAENTPEYVNGVAELERQFSKILRGKVKP